MILSKMTAMVLGLLMFAVALGAETAAPDYAALGKAVIEELSASQFEKVEAQFDAKMTSAAPVSTMQNLWQQIITQHGPFRAVTRSSVSERGQYHVVVISAQFEKGVINFTVAFDSDGKVGGFFIYTGRLGNNHPWTPPAYVNAGSFHEMPVTVGSAPYTLSGTLTMPNGQGPFPAVALVQGSGSHDEDETIGPNKPFKDLAWGLASRGIAVLRYVKRTQQYPKIVHKPSFTVMEETVDDARAAVSLLAARPGIDPKRIYVLGHSLGGMLAPRIAQGDPQITGIILMAGNTEHLGPALVRQMKYIASLKGIAPGQGDKSIEAAEATEQQSMSPSLKPSDTVNFMGANLPGSYLLDLRSYNPAATAASLKIPMLLLQGGRDYNVTVPNDFNVWKKALTGHSNVEFRFYPTLDHLFMTGSEPPSPRDFFTSGHVSGQVIDNIAEWVKAQR
ncbi:MAG: alpha/beta hydrolase [Terriglobia bacterium]